MEFHDMARIRTIKPDFWTSEQVVGCSIAARLMFIGLWNFCDDNGVFCGTARTIKMKVFPGDDYSLNDIEMLKSELVDCGLLEDYEVDQIHYLYVTGWTKHQKIQ